VPPPDGDDGDDVTAGDGLLAGQVDYYRHRAREYDATAYPDLDAARERITRIVAALRPAGDVLEIACGTGLWTGALAEAAATVTAIDAAPEAIAIARGRVTAANVRFEVADVFSWTAPARFDTVFFAFWLSHVPASRFGPFWRQLHGLVAGHGRVLLVDEHPDVRGKEDYAAGSGEVIHRRLADGSEHRLVKVFVHPGQLRARLSQLGWQARIHRDGPDWVIGEARPADHRGRTSGRARFHDKEEDQLSQDRRHKYAAGVGDRGSARGLT
jgi:2-polyprenyl-3-methyl-5-hydroxy-6-metoxy-1,4-benzoquinol methylase